MAKRHYTKIRITERFKLPLNILKKVNDEDKINAVERFFYAFKNSMYGLNVKGDNAYVLGNFIEKEDEDGYPYYDWSDGMFIRHSEFETFNRNLLNYSYLYVDGNLYKLPTYIDEKYIIDFGY